MEVMTLDKAIQHCQEVAQGQSELYDCYLQHGEQGEHVQNCLKCGTEHRQLAEWLKEYKRLLEQEPKTGHWKPKVDFDDTRYGYTCDMCNNWARDKSDYCPNCGARMECETV